MSPLCPTCHGDCCVNKHGSVADHGAALALHSCPDCSDGFAPALAGHTAEQKRVAVDAWLRAPAGPPYGFKPCPLCGSTVPDEPNELDDLRVGIERVRAEVEAAHAEAATMRSWAEEAAEAENANADDARRERAAVVAWLRALRAGYAGSELMTLAADDIERGEHRREEEK